MIETIHNKNGAGKLDPPLSGLRLTFLGTGTSTGVPMINCDCEVCTSDDPRDSRTRSSVYLRANDAAWVIDTGPEFRIQCLREKIETLDAAVFSHAHTDHIMGFDDLRRFSTFKEEFFPVYGAPGTIGMIKKCFAFAFQDDAPFYYLRPKAIIVEEPFRLGRTTLTPLDLPHGRFITTGYLMSQGDRKLLAYCNDCHEIPKVELQKIAGVEVLVVDGLRYLPHPSHMTIEQAVETGRNVGAKQTYLTHMSDDVLHDAADKKLPEGFNLAFDGLTVAIT